jgi:hypothetical protein
VRRFKRFSASTRHAASHIVSKPWERSTVRSLALVKYVHDILLDRCGARGARSARRGARGVGSSR